MKTFAGTLTLCLSVLGAPAPQDLPDPSEVELIPPVENEGVDYEDPVVIVVRPSSFNPFDFGGFSGFPGFSNLPKLPASFGGFGSSDDVPGLSLDEIFGSAGEQPLVPQDTTKCGLICKVFNTLESQLGVMQGEIDGLKTQLHNKEIPESDYDNHTKTYDEKVLPDGSILRINKTTIHDTDDNGNGFFFHSSIHHVIQDNEDDKAENDTVTEDEITEDKDDVTEKVVIGEASTVSAAGIDKIESADPAINEIAEKFPTLDIDDGLFE